MPHADNAAAPALLTPRTLRNRLRSMPSVMVPLVMTHAAIACHLVFDVTAHAPPHAQRRDLGHLRHPLYFPVARRDRKSTRLNSSHMSISYAVFCLKKKNKHHDLISTSN